jgi:hypothetical protein
VLRYSSSSLLKRFLGTCIYTPRAKLSAQKKKKKKKREEEEEEKKDKETPLPQPS